MDRLGTFALLVALALAVYGLVAAVTGARRSKPLHGGERPHDGVLAVRGHGGRQRGDARRHPGERLLGSPTSRRTPAARRPTFFKVLSLWSADEGSLLLWNLILAGYIAAVAFRFRRAPPRDASRGRSRCCSGCRRST